MKDERYYAAYLEHNRISRRGLFRALIGGGQKAQAESAAELLKRAVARPPFAVAEPLFLKSCNGCGDCVSACPYGPLCSKRARQALRSIFLPVISVVNVPKSVQQGHWH